MQRWRWTAKGREKNGVRSKNAKTSPIVYGLALLVPPLVASPPAEAGLLVGGVVGSSATGAIKESFDSLAPGGAATTTLPSGLTMSWDGDAGPVSGSVLSIHAAPLPVGR
jgi:hypothetical protein